MNLHIANDRMNIIPVRLYRYVDPYPPEIMPVLQEYMITRETTCGWWIKRVHGNPFDISFGDEKWVKKDADRPFVFDTIDEAVRSYRNRKLAHLRHLQTKMNQIQGILSRIEGVEPEDGGYRDTYHNAQWDEGLISFGKRVFGKSAWEEDFLSETEMKVQ